MTHQKFTNQGAGPRQIKGLQQAASALLRTAQEHVEVTGVVGGEEHRTVLFSMFGPAGNAEALRLFDEVGQKYAWTITKDNFRAIEADLVAALPAARAARPVVDERRTPDEVAACQARRAEQDEKNRRASRREVKP